MSAYLHNQLHSIQSHFHRGTRNYQMCLYILKNYRIHYHQLHIRLYLERTNRHIFRL